LDYCGILVAFHQSLGESWRSWRGEVFKSLTTKTPRTQSRLVEAHRTTKEKSFPELPDSVSSRAKPGISLNVMRYDAQPVTSILRNYVKETRRPVYSAVLLLPFFVVYHAGSIVLKTTYINGADALIMRILSTFSVHSVFASALVLLACFVVWQLRTRASWKVDSRKLLLMLGESLFFAALLFVAFGWISTHLSAVDGTSGLGGGMTRLVLYCGAGIYEELVFRGFLLGMLLLLFTRLLKMTTVTASICATLLAALLFSLFHYLGAAGDHFTLASFVQRTLGGLYFSVLFVTRGFGVTAASHALYDILVGLIATG
jgi:membrane protease YdiL (CAAX protease family)